MVDTNKVYCTACEKNVIQVRNGHISNCPICGTQIKHGYDELDIHTPNRVINNILRK